ncbi:MAG: exodeoxyribonuclease large subunit [Cyanobacteriota bacterium]
MTAASLPHYSITELNQAIGNLLERGFAPRFLLDATVSRPQLKKGHLWMTLSDGQASIGAVVWASQLAKLSHQPSDGDGVIVVGKLNFWANRASLTVQVLDLRPSLSTVLRQFEQVSRLLELEGLLDPARKRPLPVAPQHIAVLTSVPSSALADLLRTARERWPSARVLVVPIPVQGAVEAQICQALAALGERAAAWGLEAVVLARGGGSREDLAVFDSEAVARAVAACPLPVVTGVGHEDDTTVVDLVADHRAATPTGAMVALLPDRSTLHRQLERSSAHLRELVRWRLQHERGRLQRLQETLLAVHPRQLLLQQRKELNQQQRLLQALSPQHWLERGFSLIRNSRGVLISSVQDLPDGERVTLQLADGERNATIDASGAKTMTQTSSKP